MTEAIDRLSEENQQLREGLRSRARIDQAMGVLVAVGGITPEQAWDMLREVSMRTNTKLRTVAELLVRWPVGGTLPEEVRRSLAAALSERRAA